MINSNLIVKKNFYIQENKKVFIPTGSSLKILKHSKSTMPYYELNTYVIFLEKDRDEIILRITQPTGAKNPRLTNLVFNNKIIDIYWDEVFVQDFSEVINYSNEQ